MACVRGAATAATAATTVIAAAAEGEVDWAVGDVMRKDERLLHSDFVLGVSAEERLRPRVPRRQYMDIPPLTAALVPVMKALCSSA